MPIASEVWLVLAFGLGLKHLKQDFDYCKNYNICSTKPNFELGLPAVKKNYSIPTGLGYPIIFLKF
jgi:hypothetical protein